MDPLKAPPAQENKLHFLDYWRIIRIRKTVILAVFLLVVITAALVTFVLPKKYMSKASIKVDRPNADIAEFTSRGMSGVYDPYFIQTEFEAIKSETVLTNVIARLDLNNKWGRRYNNGERLKTADTLEALRGRLDLRPVRNTMFIEIGVISDKADDAAELANVVAEAYRDHRLEEIRRASEGGIKTLEDRFEEQQKKVAEAQKKVNELKASLGVTESGFGN